MEKPYEFRNRLTQVHEKDIRDFGRIPRKGEFFLPEVVHIGIEADASEIVRTATQDFCDFLRISMGITGVIHPDNSHVHIRATLNTDLGDFATYKGFRIDTCFDGITIAGYDDRGIAQAFFYLEMMMEFSKAPAVDFGRVEKKPMFSPRMIHSGYGLDEYPEEYLARIAHEGRDAILVFTKGVNETPHGYLNFNDLIRRAARWGLDVYAYSYMVSNMSPEAPEAEAFYENTYGKLFRECPGLKGVTLVGESVEFPSKDPHVAKGRYFETYVDGLPPGKPSSGWYPCFDYAIWLNLLKRIVRKYNEKADIVFWTYNWGNQPEEARVALINSLPTDISLQATFEMHEPKLYGSVYGRCCDYTLSFEGPGKYFRSEAIAAKKRGIRLYSMTNTGGTTWDFGTIPYEPMPYQWIRRFEAIRKAHDDWGLVGLMESHHFGFFPSFISRLGNLGLLEPREDMELLLHRILKSKFGENNFSQVNAAMECWSNAIRYYTPCNSDQYGAFRVGPSFPFCLMVRYQLPSDPKAMFGNGIIEPMYNPARKYSAPMSILIHEEICSLQEMRNLVDTGIAFLEEAPEQNEELVRLTDLGKYISNVITTGYHAKQWYVLKTKLFAEEDRVRYAQLLDEMENLLDCEIENTDATFPLVEADSRLGWEPSMLYIGDRWHLDWKKRQVAVVRTEIQNERNNLNYFVDKKDISCER